MCSLSEAALGWTGWADCDSFGGLRPSGHLRGRLGKHGVRYGVCGKMVDRQSACML